jgi:hypothetical protein
LKTDVPDEVREALNMDSLNLHSQHDKFFMLQETAGERGRMLNDYCNISAIDAVLSKTDSMMRKTKQELEELKAAKIKTETSLSTLPDYAKYVIMIERLETKIKKLDEIKKQKESLSELIGKNDWMIESIIELDQWIAVGKRVNKIIPMVQNYQAVFGKWLDIKNLCTKYSLISKEVSEADGWNDLIEAILKFIPKIVNWNSMVYNQKQLATIVQKWKQTDDDIHCATLAHDELNLEFNQLLKDSGTCPLCGAKQ